MKDFSAFPSWSFALHWLDEGGYCFQNSCSSMDIPFKMAVLMLIVHFGTLLIGEEGAKLQPVERVKGEAPAGTRTEERRTIRGSLSAWCGN